MLKIDIFLKNHLHLCSGKELVPSISERLIFVLSVQSLNFIWYSAQLQSYLQYGKCWLRSKVRGPAYQHWQQIFWTLIHFKYTQSTVCFSCKKIWIFIMLKIYSLWLDSMGASFGKVISAFRCSATRAFIFISVVGLPQTTFIFTLPTGRLKNYAFISDQIPIKLMEFKKCWDLQFSIPKDNDLISIHS